MGTGRLESVLVARMESGVPSVSADLLLSVGGGFGDAGDSPGPGDESVESATDEGSESLELS